MYRDGKDFKSLPPETVLRHNFTGVMFFVYLLGMMISLRIPSLAETSPAINLVNLVGVVTPLAPVRVPVHTHRYTNDINMVPAFPNECFDFVSALFRLETSITLEVLYSP